MTTLREVAQQIREHADIVETIGGYVELRRAGSQWKGLCPFHREKTPSFHVHPGRQGWHCFGCGKGGSVIDFIMGIEKLEFPEAVELLARRLGIEMPSRAERRDPAVAKESERKRDALLRLNHWALRWFQTNLKAEPHGPAAAYLARRRVQPRLAEIFQIGYSPDVWHGLLEAAKAQGFSEDLLIEAGLVVRNPESGTVYDRFRGRLIFPILDHLGRCIGFGGRLIAEDPEKQVAKYINSSETPLYQKGRSLYGLFQAEKTIEKKGRALVVEGYLDCIMAHQGGFSETVATLGTALTPDQARILRRFCREVVFVYDGDEAGQQAMCRGAEILVRAKLHPRVAVLPPKDDPDSLILREGPEGFAQFIDQAADIYDYLLDLALPKGESSEILQRITAVDSVGPLLAAIEDPVERSLRVQAVAKRVGVETAAIESYLARRTRKAVRRRAPAAADGMASGGGPTSVSSPDGLPVPRVELGVLRGVLENERFTEWVRTCLDPHWMDPAMAEVIGRILELKQRGEFDSLEFYGALEGHPRTLYALALFNDELQPPCSDRECDEVRTRLEVRYLKKCAGDWLDSMTAILRENPDNPPSQEAWQEFHRLHREAQECVRRLARNSFIVPTAIRFTHF